MASCSKQGITHYNNFVHMQLSEITVHSAQDTKPNLYLGYPPTKRAKLISFRYDLEGSLSL